ncbi:hypothetical protein JKP88DRAFT_202289 [Tribonema minus]|uniref:Fe2OG dioxygenase domain-containing protein n=1 Tax=Tribonema minus TaxID=303371 RepID=A0A835YVY9_9STRA|nr:hypothetical protein JKP88DRAFT_202289 [Tribonema minus]
MPTARRSTVLNEGETSDVRTSATCWLREDDCAASAALLAPITERVAAMSEQPASHQENLQVVRYGPEQEYQEHTDHIDSFNELEFGGRMSTCLIYLNGGDDFDGGRTAFPRLTPRAAPVVPEAGAALFFVNVRLPCADPFAMAVHEASLHAGLPLTRGTKYVCNKWVHPVPMQRAEPAE